MIILSNKGENEGALRGRAGVITGAARGIGRAIAIRLAQQGADVGINYWRSEESARRLQDEINIMGRRTVLLKCNVSKEEEVCNMAEEAHRELGKIDFLVNNAGGDAGAKTDDSIEKADFHDWNTILGTNLTGSFLCMRYLTPFMLQKKRGRVVNISSICGLTGDCGPAYCSAKAGLLGLTRSSAVSLAPYVQVNAILPGFVSSQPHSPELVSR
ncbi:MAG: SDR family NAD(P)-dependent oxidoreductase [Nitrososphaerales archaeon]